MQASRITTTYSLVRQQKINHSIPTISTPNQHTQHIATTYSIILNLNTPTILPPVGKEYMCFLKDGKTAQSARCIKSRRMTKVINYVLLVDTFEQKIVVLKGMLQSPQLKDHVHTIDIDQYISKNAIYEHKCLENIKKIYKQAGKCDDQQQFKDILEDDMFSTPEGFTNDSPISPMTSTPVKKPRARK